MVLGGRHRGGGGVPIKAGDVSGGGGEVLETVLAGRPQVVALVLSHLDLPLPGGGRGPRVDVDVDGVTLIGGRHEHVLAGVVAADHWMTLQNRKKNGNFPN